MKIFYKYVLLLVMFAVMLPACDDLARAPLDAPSDVTFYSNEQELLMAINGAYRGLWWGYDRVPAPMLLDNATDLGFLRGEWFNADLAALPRGAGTSETSIFQSTWSHFYSSIAKVNNLLDNMSRSEEVVDEVTLRRVEAEARFLRAFFYHWLAELYGDVPLLTSVPKVEESQIGRTSKSEVVDQILADLDIAAEILPDSWNGEDEGRATRWAALALKARVALYNERFSVAEEAAKQIIDSQMFSLHPDYEEAFKYSGIRNSGVIFDAPYQVGIQTTQYPQHQGIRSLGGWSDVVPSQFLVDSYEAVDGHPIDHSAVYDPSQPFENRDPRLDASILRPQGVFNNIVFETHPDSTETWRLESDGQRTRITNQDVTNPFATFTGYTWRKYVDPDDFPENRNSSTINWIYMRYAEVLLTYVEARIESGNINQSVLDAINEVRARAYGAERSEMGSYPAITTTSQQELRQIVRRERKVELANEGFRLFDIRRWGIADQVMDGPLIGRPVGEYGAMNYSPQIDAEAGHPDYSGAIDQYRQIETRVFNVNRDWLWAIPQAEINVNENMVQNPGY